MKRSAYKDRRKRNGNIRQKKRIEGKEKEDVEKEVWKRAR
jgi:hypothetical protein